jgi:hypothetical protein
MVIGEQNPILIYKTYLDHLRENESHALKFLVIMVAGIGSAVYSIFPKEAQNGAIDVSLTISLAGTLLLLWGVLYTLAMSYTHRYLQRLMAEYEKRFEIPHYNQWHGKKKRNQGYCKNSLIWDIAPSPYKSHLLGYYFGIGFIWFSYMKNKKVPICCALLITLGALLALYLLIVGLVIYKRDKLIGLFKEGIK